MHHSQSAPPPLLATSSTASSILSIPSTPPIISTYDPNGVILHEPYPAMDAVNHRIAKVSTDMRMNMSTGDGARGMWIWHEGIFVHVWMYASICV